MNFNKRIIGLISLVSVIGVSAFAHLDQENGMEKVHKLAQILNQARYSQKGPTPQTHDTIKNINDIFSGKTSRISQKFATAQQREQA